jgi:hypothetical protein
LDDATDLAGKSDLPNFRSAARSLQECDPNVEHRSAHALKGFAEESCKAVRAECRAGEARDLRELIAANRIIPDAYLLEVERKTVYLYEIEDTHPIKPEKLRKLSSIRFRLDCLDWELRVFLLDRYLTAWPTLPMADVWHSLSSPDPSLSEILCSRHIMTSFTENPAETPGRHCFTAVIRLSIPF